MSLSLTEKITNFVWILSFINTQRVAAVLYYYVYYLAILDGIIVRFYMIKLCTQLLLNPSCYSWVNYLPECRQSESNYKETTNSFSVRKFESTEISVKFFSLCNKSTPFSHQMDFHRAIKLYYRPCHITISYWESVWFTRKLYGWLSKWTVCVK